MFSRKFFSQDKDRLQVCISQPGFESASKLIFLKKWLYKDHDALIRRSAILRRNNWTHSSLTLGMRAMRRVIQTSRTRLNRSLGARTENLAKK
jgi:hypothetical protein